LLLHCPILSQESLPSSNVKVQRVLPTGNAKALKVLRTGNARAQKVLPTGNARVQRALPTGNVKVQKGLPTGSDKALKVLRTGNARAQKVLRIGNDRVQRALRIGNVKVQRVLRIGNAKVQRVHPTGRDTRQSARQWKHVPKSKHGQLNLSKHDFSRFLLLPSLVSGLSLHASFFHFWSSHRKTLSLLLSEFAPRGSASQTLTLAHQSSQSPLLGSHSDRHTPLSLNFFFILGTRTIVTHYSIFGFLFFVHHALHSLPKLR
jgi:hypothetical protein